LRTESSSLKEENLRKDREEEAGRGGGKPGGSDEVECQDGGARAVMNGETLEPETREGGVEGCQGLGVHMDEDEDDGHPSKIDGAGGAKPGEADETTTNSED
jgi:hypothetical protein